jgi:hypothetical protein
MPLQDDYSALEEPICDIRNMAAIVSQFMEQEGGIEAGDVVITARSWETFSFAVYHLQKMINDLHDQYHGEDEPAKAEGA